MQDKTAVIAGVGPGLGKEVARLALEAGANVVIGARNVERLASIAKELDPSGARVAHAPCDLDRGGDVEPLVSTALGRFDRIDALACVAARIDITGTIETTAPQAWRDVYEVNVVGTVRVIQAALPALKERGVPSSSWDRSPRSTQSPRRASSPTGLRRLRCTRP